MINATVSQETTTDLIVIGGGLAGLTAAASAARCGHSVLLLEKSSRVGGRAGTTVRDGISFNLGPHALYREGTAFHVLRKLGVPFEGDEPAQGQSQLLFGGTFSPWPQQTTAWLRSPLFTMREKLRAGSILKTITNLDPESINNLSVAAWVRDVAGTGNLARMVKMLLRLSTFVFDEDHQSAGAALEQFQLGQRGNVWYVSEGWQTLVDGLRKVATSHGTRIDMHAPAERVEVDPDTVRVIRQDGSVATARAIIIATDPAEAAKLLPLPASHATLQRAKAARPARAACLDVALKELPNPQNRFALGLDEPIYYSVHSGPAKLAPEGIAVLHMMRYLGPDRRDGAETEQDLEHLLDLLQPGWHDRIVARRFLPGMTVMGDVPAAHRNGLVGRAPVAIADLPRVFLAGDWVGRVGQLADAAVASGEAACKEALNVIATGNVLELA